MSSFLVAFVLLLYLSLNLPGLRATAGNDNESFVFSGFTAATNLILDGTAMVTQDGLLELTNNEANIKGHVFYKTPIQLKKSSSANGTAAAVQSFSAAFVFAILPAVSSTSSSSNQPVISTDGMAFVIAPSTNISDAGAAQFMGFLDSAAMNRTFAVEMDTVQNLELQDIDNNHVGVHNGSLFSMDSRTAGVYHDDGKFTAVSLIREDGEAMQAWVDYDGRSKQINVTLAPMGMAKPSKPLISNISDLAAVLTADEAYVGFSAATGPLPSQHCVLAWSFAVNGPAPPIDFTAIPKLPNSGDDYHDKALEKDLEIGLPIAAVVLIAGTCIAVVVLVRRHLTYAELREDWEVEFGPHRFCYKELFMATEGFKSKHLLGAGGFGKVYKGVLPNSGTEVAVKRVSHDSNQGLKEFISEVVSIGHLRHRNLVRLLGYCRRKGELLLVYEFMPGGSLDKYLYDDGDGAGAGGKTAAAAPPPVLEWGRRMQIVKDVAAGLVYLHERWEKVVVHRDVKASNVLLDGAMAAHLGDFGLARLHEHGGDLQTTHVVGTMGYIAPELSRTGKASPLTDVFAFGTFLLEVVCGRRPVVDTVRHGRKLLVDRVLEFWRRGTLEETVDGRLRGRFDVGEARMVLTLGLMCSHPFPGERPTMRQVVQYLDGDAPLPELTPADVSLLSLMQNQTSFDDKSGMEYPWSGNSMGTMTPGISEGR